MAETQPLTLPDNLLAEVQQAAHADGRAVNELLIEAVQRYMKDRQWEAVKKFGREKSRERGLKPSDVARFIREDREEQRRR